MVSRFTYLARTLSSFLPPKSRSVWVVRNESLLDETHVHRSTSRSVTKGRGPERPRSRRQDTLLTVQGNVLLVSSPQTTKTRSRKCMIDTLELFQSDDLGNKGLGVGPVSSGLESPIPYFDPWIV